jgi:hypothetical protein
MKLAGMALAAFEIAAAEMAIRLHVSDRGLDGGAARQLAFDEAEDVALLAGDEDAARIGGVVAAIALVDIGALDFATGELLGGVDDAAERMSVVGIARQCLGVEHDRARSRASKQEFMIYELLGMATSDGPGTRNSTGEQKG